MGEWHLHRIRPDRRIRKKKGKKEGKFKNLTIAFGLPLHREKKDGCRCRRTTLLRRNRKGRGERESKRNHCVRGFPKSNTNLRVERGGGKTKGRPSTSSFPGRTGRGKSHFHQKHSFLLSEGKKGRGKKTSGPTARVGEREEARKAHYLFFPWKGAPSSSFRGADLQGRKGRSKCSDGLQTFYSNGKKERECLALDGKEKREKNLGRRGRSALKRGKRKS